jgi:hypothetical protein
VIVVGELLIAEPVQADIIVMLASAVRIKDVLLISDKIAVL